MTSDRLTQLWSAINRARALPEGTPRDVRSAVFNEHFVDVIRQGDTQRSDKVDVAAFLGSLLLEWERGR